MIEVSPNLFVGAASDYEQLARGNCNTWSFVQACKDPYHRQALGYRTIGAPKGDPEYLIAMRGRRLILNMVDVANPIYFSKSMIDKALDFIEEQIAAGQQVLVHCNQGESRGPSIALLYMAARLHALPTTSLAEAEAAFLALYPLYAPKLGIQGHLGLYWSQYCREGKR